MSHIRLFLFFFITIGIFIFFGVLTEPAATSQAAQTVPTRTPIPDPPTAVPPTSRPSQPPPPPQATVTNTAEPTTIPTVTSTPTMIPTIFMGVTAEPCGRQPTVWAISTANLRLGPGTDYAIVGNLIFNEARAIVGRAESAEWWLLPLTETETAWVSNSAVTVQGDISQLPIVPAPSIHGATPTAAAEKWNPTPNPICPTAVPATATATASPSSISVAAVDTAVPALTATPEPSPTDTIAPTLTATAVPINTPALPPTAVPTAVPLDDGVEEEGTAVSNFLLIGGGLLLLSGVLLFIFKRKSS